jgi:hypothetical protein
MTLLFMIPSGQGKGAYIDLYLTMIRDEVAVKFARGQLRRLLDSDDIDLEFAALRFICFISVVLIIPQSKSLGRSSRA